MNVFRIIMLTVAVCDVLFIETKLFIMENNDKRVLRVELDDEVKKVSITGKNSDEKVVMRQELSEEDLDMVTGGAGFNGLVIDDNVNINLADFPHGTSCGSDGWWSRGNNELNPVQGHAYGDPNTWH